MGFQPPRFLFLQTYLLFVILTTIRTFIAFFSLFRALGYVRELFFAMEIHLFDRMNKHGDIETIDMYTGSVVASSANTQTKQTYEYSIAWGDALCEAIRNGLTYKQINDHPKLPPMSVVYRWKELHPDFVARLKAARIDRAEYYRDMAVLTAEDTETKDEATVNRLKVDTYKWAAAKDDPAKFENNLKVDTKHSGQVGFFALRTGVPHNEGEKELTEGKDGLIIEENNDNDTKPREDHEEDDPTSTT